mmetsp:Transcript_23846/g.36213  ORF Transcript_23846/g.36213 Transcript_23846/m.36213 type:complete len:257 (+) Transcript_23846:134-904(+)|eukprot:CAMPEP_0178915482 /NCGR_PEP_ID=MMETSP0786-20121207/12050_1 /TAXON_ID=186022 /ORGANISM="Thalassionema frauenfeldii, Strain CCMP 1798" /LENGTH=256 /DNA_ID=CAMNT_0020588595 /DNA_START=79 /DNA_END=849 /DNA_ORIENTATION=-
MAKIASSSASVSSSASTSSSARRDKKKAMEANDEAIAQALARQEEESAAEMLAKAMGAMGGGILQGSPVPQQQQSQQGGGGYPAARRQVMPPSGTIPNAHPGFSKSAPEAFDEAPSLCYVPCVIGKDVCVEMMVDTGAQTSVMSLSLARQLGMESRIDRRHMGIAAGVGRAKIVGKLVGVICELGQVEFVLNFTVLDVPDKLLLLGLDLMRKYRCIVNLDKDTLVFGGEGGVEVSLLPPTEQHINLRNQLVGCPQM